MTDNIQVQKTKSKFLKPLAFLGTVLIAVMSFLYLAYGYNYSEGKRVGYIRKMSYKGWIKTGEGEMALEGISQTKGGAISNVWEFSTPIGDKTIVKKLEQAMDEGRPVSVTYEQRAFPSIQITDTAYLITDVKIIEATKPVNPNAMGIPAAISQNINKVDGAASK